MPKDLGIFHTKSSDILERNASFYINTQKDLDSRCPQRLPCPFATWNLFWKTSMLYLVKCKNKLIYHSDEGVDICGGLYSARHQHCSSASVYDVASIGHKRRDLFTWPVKRERIKKIDNEANTRRRLPAMTWLFYLALNLSEIVINSVFKRRPFSVAVDVST